MTTNNKLDNDTVRRLSKLISGSKTSTNSTPIMTGTVVQNDNSLYVAIDDDTLVPISDTNSNVSVGDTVTLALDDNKALIVGNITDTNATTSEVKQTNVKVAKAQATAEGAEKVATNYIDIDENKGITVGNMQESTLGHNTYIDANGVSIRDGKTVLASFEDAEIRIGNNSSSSVISMCDDALKITSLNNMTILDSDADFVFNLLSDATKGGQLWLHSNSKQTQHWMQLSLPKIKFEIIYENGVGKLYCSATSWKKGNAEVYGETVLYNNTSGTTSTVTLSESAANFTYLEIYYTRMGTFTKSVKVYNANGKTVNLTDFYKMDDTTYQSQTEDAAISGTSITRGKRFYANFVTGSTAVANGTTDSPLFAITRVVGIK